MTSGLWQRFLANSRPDRARRGRPRSMNVRVPAAAHGDLLLFLHADTIAPATLRT